MRRTRSLFEIDQESLFALGLLETEDGAPERGWEAGHDDLPPALATATRDAADKNGARRGGQRSRVLVVVAAIGVAGFVGSRLTQAAGTPTVAPRTTATSPPPAVAGPVADSVPARRRQAPRTRRAPSADASRRVRSSRPRATARPAPRARQASAPVTTPLPAVAAPAPRYAPQPPPEPEGFTGEFF